MQSKNCSRCKNNFPSTKLHWGSSEITKDGFKSHCRICDRDYNHQNRQKYLRLRLEKGDEQIKKCSCGEFFHVSIGSKKTNGTKDQCSSCMKKVRMVEVYIPFLKKRYMAILPEGFFYGN